ncbi:DsbE family thiol:disulfide interchange protein [Avibacterium sp. 20-126]|uniref:DsbE family thiol:disulfide interchange protein n=1 Tax=Avibacterium sp. 20-126 TaxID=2911524 RepID=UPI002187DBDD|nr:DsbE family thiol:disulfide interchange protein [Avibacterium sp. 20-126]
MNRKALVFLPLLLIIALCGLLLLGLQNDPKKIASALIGKPVPEFYQPDLFDPATNVNNHSLPSEVYLINVWGSWCTYCKQEHAFLMDLQKQGVPIVGLNYRDKRQNALLMLREMGNPFHLIIDDSKGLLAMKLGVDGAPETYFVDANGIIRYRYSGPLNKQIWQQEFQPLWQKFAQNAPHLSLQAMSQKESKE